MGESGEGVGGGERETETLAEGVGLRVAVTGRVPLRETVGVRVVDFSGVWVTVGGLGVMRCDAVSVGVGDMLSEYIGTAVADLVGGERLGVWLGGEIVGVGVQDVRVAVLSLSVSVNVQVSVTDRSSVWVLVWVGVAVGGEAVWLLPVAVNLDGVKLVSDMDSDIVRVTEGASDLVRECVGVPVGVEVLVKVKVWVKLQVRVKEWCWVVVRVRVKETVKVELKVRDVGVLVGDWV